MPRFTQSQVWKVYEDNLGSAEKALKRLQVFSGRSPTFTGLTGWVFEQTIQYCLRSDLEARGLSFTIEEQAKLGARGKADLLLGRVAIEVKLSGLFSEAGIATYRKYSKLAHKARLDYLYITGGERYKHYRDGVASAVGPQNVFFLDTPREWNRFVNRVVALLKPNRRSRPRLGPKKVSGLTTR
jgi:hypothetical protein